MAEKTEMEVALESIRQADAMVADAKVVNGSIPFLVLPQALAIHDLESLLPAPARIRATPTFVDAASFCTYVERYGTDDTTLFGAKRTGTLVARLDYHGPQKPSWDDHTATLSLTQSGEWKQWGPRFGSLLGQVEFAEFIEDNLADIVEPEGALILEIAKFFQVKREVTFESQRNLQNGAVQLTFHEAEQAGGGKGNTVVPETITVRLRVYEGGPQYDLVVRLRYDLNREGKLHFKMVVAQAQKVLDRAFEDICAAVSERTGRRVLLGTP
jgi:uncharacterized protein YfdQ (DUF2303 family)